LILEEFPPRQIDKGSLLSRSRLAPVNRGRVHARPPVVGTNGATRDQQDQGSKNSESGDGAWPALHHVLYAAPGSDASGRTRKKMEYSTGTMIIVRTQANESPNIMVADIETKKGS